MTEPNMSEKPIYSPDERKLIEDQIRSLAPHVDVDEVVNRIEDAVRVFRFHLEYLELWVLRKKSQRKAIERVAKAAGTASKATRALTEALASLDSSSAEYVEAVALSPSEARSTLENAALYADLAHDLARRAHERIPRRGEQEDVKARLCLLRDLAAIYEDLTGHPPTRSHNPRLGRDTGRFLKFAKAVIGPLDVRFLQGIEDAVRQVAEERKQTSK